MSDGLRDRLVEQQQRNRAFEERFRQEISNMTEKKLTPLRRIGYGFGGIMGLFFVGLFGYVAWTAPSEFPLLARLTFVLGAAFGAAWAGISAYVLKKGSFNLKTDENMAHGLTWGFAVLMMTAFLIMGGRMEDRTQGIFLALYGLVFFIMFAIPAFISLRINRLELGVRERLLRMEITLAELAGNRGVLEVGAPPATTRNEQGSKAANKTDPGDAFHRA